MSEQTPPEDVLPIVVRDQSRGAPAADGARFITITRRDPVDGSPAHGPGSDASPNPLNWQPQPPREGINGQPTRQVSVQLVAGEDELESTKVVDPESGLAAAIGDSFAVEQLQEGQPPILALRITGAQIDPGLGVSTLLRKGWTPRRRAGGGGTRPR